MLKLFKKDWALCMHPCTIIFFLLSAMVLIPNYPYSLFFFYSGMTFFFTCLNGRENQDVMYSLMLPVAKADVVRSRMLYAASVQGIQLALVAAFCPLSQHLFPEGNPAGLRANITFVAWGILLFALYNAIFFAIYYRNVNKVGISFLMSSIGIFLCIGLEIVARYAIPFVRDVLNTPDPQYLTWKLLFLLIAVFVYAGSYFLTQKNAIRHFEAQDF